MCCLFLEDNLTDPKVTELSQGTALITLICGPVWLISAWYGRALPTVGGTVPRLVGLSCTRKLERCGHASKLESEPASGVPRASVWVSCLNSLWWIVTWKCKSNKPFPPHHLFWPMVFITATHPRSMIVYQNYTNPTQTPQKKQRQRYRFPIPFVKTLQLQCHDVTKKQEIQPQSKCLTCLCRHVEGWCNDMFIWVNASPVPKCSHLPYVCLNMYTYVWCTCIYTHT